MTIAFPRCFRALALVAIFALVGSPAQAQGTATVPPSDLLYRDLDRLSELGFLDSVIVGQRPYSRREIGRILRAARERSDQLGERSVSHLITDLELSIGDGILRRLETRFSREVDEIQSGDAVISPLDGVSLVASYTDAERRGFPGGFTRPIEATIGSLLPRRLGQQFKPGYDGGLGARPTRRAAALALVHGPGAISGLPAERHESQHPIGRSAAGRRARARGQRRAQRRSRADRLGAVGRRRAVLRLGCTSLDQISLSSDHPFVLPGFLRRLGPTQATLVVADLGPSIVRSHSKLLAYKVSIQPTRESELGATFLNHFGGEGGRPSGAVDRLIDFLPFIDIFRKHNYADSTRTLDVDSDKVLGLDGRLRLGGLRGVLLTGEMLIDDFDVRRIPKLLTGYGSQTLGITFPRFVSPLLSLRLTAAHMGIITYSHGALTNGTTTRGRLLGSELGPDAKAFGAQVTWQPIPAATLSLEGRHAIYSNAEYSVSYADENNSRYVVRKISSTPDEIRDRIGSTLLIQSEVGPAMSLRVVGERARNYLFQGGARRYFAAELALHLQQ